MADKNYHNPPRLAQRFLRWFCKPELVEDIAGDLEEDFNDFIDKYGLGRARINYWSTVLRFLRPFAVRKLFKTQNSNVMFGINSKIALRNIGKHKLYSFINISGLALGIAACLIITHYVLFQMSFDKEFVNSDTLYRVHLTRYQNRVDQGTNPNVGFGLGPAISNAAPEIEQTSLIHNYYDGAIVSKAVDSINSTPFQEKDILFVEPSFIDMFSLEFISGDPKSALEGPKSVVITESIAKKYFGKSTSPPIGKTLNIIGNWGEKGHFIISGVIKDFPKNSHLKPDFLLPMSNLMKDSQYQSDDAEWGWSNFELYVQLVPQTTESIVEEKVASLMQMYIGDKMKENDEDRVLSLQNIQDIHLRSEVTGEEGEMTSIYFLVLIASFILIIAWINFVNLSTAKASERSLEVGVKKAMGALKKQIAFQFLTESFWLNLFATVLGISVTYLLLPEMSSIIGEELSLNLSDTSVLIILASIVFLGPVLTGIYPAFIMSAFKTTDSLKGRRTPSKSKIPLRKVLVVFQFIISTLMIAGTYVVSEQLAYMQNQSTGFDMEKILIVEGPQTRVQFANFEKFRNETAGLASVESFTSSRSIPGAGFNWGTEMYKHGAEKSSRRGISVTWIDSEFMSTYQLEMISGRDFTEPIRNSEDLNVANGAIINEATLKAYNLGTAEEALTQKLVISGTVIPIRGVTKNHNWQSLHSEIAPSVFLFVNAAKEYFSIKLNTQDTEEVISSIRNFYTSSFPGNPIKYHFLDEFFDEQYKSDREFSLIFNSFALFAIVAACLGLFGLTAFSMLQKAKEIGIRKVLGAKMSQITYLFSKNYLILILIANALAIPLSYFGIQYWLQDFAYTIPMAPKLFIVPVALLLFIAMTTIFFQTIKVARSNPVDSLRSD